MFKEHLDDHGISYRAHQKLAFFFARESFKVSIMAFIHGILPNIFKTSASDLHKSILPRYQELFDNMKKEEKYT